MGSLLKRLIDTTDPTASLRHAAFALVVAFACGWLTYALHKPGLNGDWVVAFGLLLSATGAVKVLGKPVGVAAPTPQEGGTSTVRQAVLGSASEGQS